MGQHDSKHCNIIHETNIITKSVTVKALRDIAAGEELFNNYGNEDMDDIDFFPIFGFVPGLDFGEALRTRSLCLFPQ